MGRGYVAQNDTTTILLLTTATNKPWEKQQYDSALKTTSTVITDLITVSVERVECRCENMHLLQHSQEA